MLYKTEGIVLHSVKYGDSGMIVQIFTELFGKQSFMVHGVRSARAKMTKANLLQPAQILDMVIYHQEQKNLQRISEFKAAYIYQHLYANIVKNAIALYISELLYKCLSEPEPHPELFYFTRQNLQWMDGQPSGLANLPLYFTLKVAALLGFNILGKYSSETPILDMQEGLFISGLPAHRFFIDQQQAQNTSRLLAVIDKNELKTLKISRNDRHHLLMVYLEYLKLHLPGFRDLRSPQILKDVMD